jgi:predicted cupin superfamily sugar epimerase
MIDLFVRKAAMSDAKKIIELLDLVPHPEGGFFAETYRSPQRISREALPGRYQGGERSFSTAIYYLITPDGFSALHRVCSDEVFHFYLGDPVSVLLLFADGSGAKLVLGPGIEKGEQPQLVVPQGTWQGLSLLPGGRYALLGATVAPGFDFDDFSLGNRGELLERYPRFQQEISALTRE